MEKKMQQWFRFEWKRKMKSSSAEGDPILEVMSQKVLKGLLISEPKLVLQA